MASDTVGKLTFEVVADTSQAQKGLEDFNDSMVDTQKVAKETEEKVGEAESGISVKGVAIAAAVGAAVIELGKKVAEATNEIQSGRATIVAATGATGEALDGLMESAKSVYENSEESFDNVSRAIGEVNTRLGLTGEALEEATGIFLDFADVTNQDVQQSIISVTQAMNKWNMEADDLPELLDKLTYAGQASGISVSTLTQNLTQNAGTLRAMGYSMDEAIAMMMQFELQGIDSSSVLMGMKKSFEDSAKAGTDARLDWESLMYSIAYATDETQANEIAIQAFGNRIATDMVSALQDGKLNFDQFTEGLQNANGTLAETDAASKTTADRIETLKHSITLMLAEVGEEMAPLIEEMLPTVKTLIEAVFEAIKPLIPVLGDLIKTLLPPLTEIIVQLTDVLVPIIESVLPPLASLLKLVGTVLSALLSIASPLLEAVGDILEVGVKLVSSLLTPLLELITPIFQLIADAINAVLSPLLTVLSSIVGWIDKIIGGIKRLVSWLGNAAKSLFGFEKGIEESEDGLVEFSGELDKSGDSVKKYIADVDGMGDALLEGADAFGAAIPPMDDYSVAVDRTTESVKDESGAVEENTEVTEENTEAKKVSTQYSEEEIKANIANKESKEEESKAKEDDTKATKENTQAEREAILAQREAEKLAQERIRTADEWTQKLVQQEAQSEQTRASELEAAGDIEEAYAIRARLIDEEMNREIEAMQKLVAENRATEEEITNIRQYYANKQEQNNKAKTTAIQKQEEKLAKDKKEAQKKADDAIVKSSKEAKEKIKNDITNTINMVMSMANSITSIIEKVGSNIEKELENIQKAREDDLKHYKEQSNSQLAILEDKNAKGLLSDEEYKLSKKKIEDDIARYTQERTQKDEQAEMELKRKLNEANEKAFKARKATAIAQAVIDGASAIMQGFAQLGPIAGAIAAGVMAGVTAAQIAVIASEEYVPSYAIGAEYIPEDQLAMLHRGEMILTKQEATRFRDFGGLYGLEKVASTPMAVNYDKLAPLSINNHLSAVLEVDGTQLGVAVLKNIDNASAFVLR